MTTSGETLKAPPPKTAAGTALRKLLGPLRPHSVGRLSVVPCTRFVPEAVDLAAWSALTVRSLEARGENSPRLRALLLEMAALGAQAEDLAMRAGELAA